MTTRKGAPTGTPLPNAATAKSQVPSKGTGASRAGTTTRESGVPPRLLAALGAVVVGEYPTGTPVVDLSRHQPITAHRARQIPIPAGKSVALLGFWELTADLAGADMLGQMLAGMDVYPVDLPPAFLSRMVAAIECAEGSS